MNSILQHGEAATSGARAVLRPQHAPNGETLQCPPASPAIHALRAGTARAPEKTSYAGVQALACSGSSSGWMGNKLKLELQPAEKAVRAPLIAFLPLCVLCVSAFLPLPSLAHEDLMLRVKGVTEQMSTNGITAELLLLRAELYRAHQDWDLALKDYDAAAPGLTNSPALEFGRAQTLAGCGKLSKARAAFDNLLQRHPDNAAALLGRARVLAQLDHLALAIADYTRAFTNLTNPRPEDYLERARIQAAESGTDAAVKGLDEGLARIGWTVTLQRTALDYELERGNTDGALTRLDSILTRSNRKESWLTLRAEILQTAGRTQDAREAFQAALKAIIDLPPRLATSENTVKLRARIEAALASIPSGAATNIAFPKATQ